MLLLKASVTVTAAGDWLTASPDTVTEIKQLFVDLYETELVPLVSSITYQTVTMTTTVLMYLMATVMFCNSLKELYVRCYPGQKHLGKTETNFKVYFRQGKASLFV